MSAVLRLVVTSPVQSAPRRRWSTLAWAWAVNAWRAHATRRQLAELDDHGLADLGISRAQARFEAERPFWDWGR